MSPSEKIQRPYGLWDSPLTPAGIGGGKRLSDTAWDENGTLLWLEGRSDRSILVVQPPGLQQTLDLNHDISIRAKVGYGGGDFTTGKGQAFFIDAATGRIFSQRLAGDPPRPLTPAFGSAAAPRLSRDGRWLLYVHSYENQDCLAIVDAAGEHWPRRLVWGSDFYMQPSWRPDSQEIAWISWDHPNMPWDGTRLFTGKLIFSRHDLPRIETTSEIAGGETVSIFQPEYSPDGHWLAYVSDEDGWWHVYLQSLTSSERRQITSGEAEHGLPGWVQGMRTFCFAPDGKSIYTLRNREGFASLWRLDLASGSQERVPVGEEYTWLEQPAISPDGRQIALIASGSRTPLRLIRHTLGHETHVVQRMMPEDIPAETWSAAHNVRWQGEDGGEVYGLYYPPLNPEFEDSGPPPLIVLVHGGPTGQVNAAFSAQVQFFTTRGYAVLEANFRGSSGYGRAYRNQLLGNWGTYDVTDNLSGARFLAEQGLADINRMVIMGGSSGGFSVLQTLIEHPGFFRAGIDLYGVSNQFSLAQDTHKFEAHYSERLLGKLPEAAETYRARSPVFFAEKISDPLAVFQGEADNVVPRAQSDEIVASLRSRGVPHIYHVYPGEGHGFRKSENIEHMYLEIERFLLQHM